MSAIADNLALARRTILAPGGLDEGRLDRTLGLVMDHAVDAADLYFQVSREESWALEDGIVKEGSASIEEGVGVRAISGEKTGFAYSDEIQPEALEEASRAARAIAKQPDVLLCDEPTGALDYKTGIQVLEVIDRVNRELGTSTAVITHNAPVAQMADRVVTLADGLVVSDVKPAQKRRPHELSW